MVRTRKVLMSVRLRLYWMWLAPTDNRDRSWSRLLTCPFLMALEYLVFVRCNWLLARTMNLCRMRRLDLSSNTSLLFVGNV